MEEKKYRSGFEKYLDIAESIKKQCSIIPGTVVKQDGKEKTLYIWNGYKVYISDDSVEIFSEDNKSFLGAYSGKEKHCQFGQISPDHSLKLTGVYSPTITDSFVNSSFQKIESQVSNDISVPSNINLVPTSIGTIVEEEMKKARETMEHSDEYNKQYIAQYINELGNSLKFFTTVEELTRTDRDLEASTHELSGAQKILDFVKRNNLTTTDLAQALEISQTLDSKKQDDNIEK